VKLPRVMLFGVLVGVSTLDAQTSSLPYVTNY
jgi:hypothetical protein